MQDSDGVYLIFDFGNLQTDSQNIQVAVNLSDNVFRPNHLSAQGEALNLTSNDANHNNSEQQQTQAANVNNSMMLSPRTNIPIFVNQSTNNQNDECCLKPTVQHSESKCTRSE